MPAPRRHPEFDPAADFEYPAHLRPQVEALPPAPGVYIFHGETGDLPLYIGKSVNIRSRVLSHLRTEDEARMLRQTRHISHIRTAGEVGALLLEARLIKAQQPLYNRQLRRTRQLCAWSLPQDGGPPTLVSGQEVDFARTPNLYGLYASRRAAQDALRALADDLRLCYGALGLEKLSPGRGCFRSMLRQCAGVCCGRETPEAHRERLLAGLDDWRVQCWPYPGPVALIERGTDPHNAPWVQWHIVRHWCYLGSLDEPAATPDQLARLTSVATGFDADGYKILCKPMVGGVVEVRLL
jgi:excinuclease Cho